MAETEGVVKYRLDFEQGEAPEPALIDSVNSWRRILHQLALVGSDPNRYGGLGFGNVSRRVHVGEPAFVISGTQTGHLSELHPEHYCLVSDCDAQSNTVVARGTIRPSSEALTHGALYDADPSIQCVLHAHSPDIWNQARRLGLPTTRQDIEYGTPAMAAEVGSLAARPEAQRLGVLAMAGHQDGVLAFGGDEEQAGLALVAVLAWSYRA